MTFTIMMFLIKNGGYSLDILLGIPDWVWLVFTAIELGMITTAARGGKHE